MKTGQVGPPGGCLACEWAAVVVAAAERACGVNRAAVHPLTGNDAVDVGIVVEAVEEGAAVQRQVLAAKGAQLPKWRPERAHKRLLMALHCC